MSEPRYSHQEVLSDALQVRLLRGGRQLMRARALPPPPIDRWKATLGLQVSRADALFRAGRFREACEALRRVVESPRAYGNPFTRNDGEDGDARNLMGTAGARQISSTADGKMRAIERVANGL